MVRSGGLASPTRRYACSVTFFGLPSLGTSIRFQVVGRRHVWHAGKMRPIFIATRVSWHCATYAPASTACCPVRKVVIGPCANEARAPATCGAGAGQILARGPDGVRGRPATAMHGQPPLDGGQAISVGADIRRGGSWSRALAADHRVHRDGLSTPADGRAGPSVRAGCRRHPRPAGVTSWRIPATRTRVPSGSCS